MKKTNCSNCGRPRSECRTRKDPFLSCCNICAMNDGDTHTAAPKEKKR